MTKVVECSWKAQAVISGEKKMQINGCLGTPVKGSRQKSQTVRNKACPVGGGGGSNYTGRRGRKDWEKEKKKKR